MSNTKKALKTEASKNAAEKYGFKAQMVEVEFEGDVYSVSNENAIDADFVETYESGKTVAAARLLVGDTNYEKFKASGAGGKRNIFEVLAFLNAVIETANGVDLGESTD